MRTRISMFLNADPEEFPRTLPYTYNRGEVDLHAQFLVEEGQMVIEVGGTPVILSRAQAEDLFEVLDMRINGDLDVAPGGGPRRVDVNGELVAE